MNDSWRWRRRHGPACRALDFFQGTRQRIVQLGLNNVGELLRFRDHRGRFFNRDWNRPRRSRSFRGNFSRFTRGAEMSSNLVGDFVVKRTGMRLFLDPEDVKIFEDEVTFNLQFTRQNVDSYVAHSVFLITLPCFPPLS
jgi:hypothetical protein